MTGERRRAHAATTDQGETAPPGVTVQLGADLAPELEEGVTGFQWSVDQPPGSAALFVPSASVRSPTFEAWVVGTYTFHLDVIDTQGQVRRAGSYLMAVRPADGLHVELTWQTPGDPDETDTGGSAGFSAGSDVDLHLLHPNANGRFFDWTYDCYWETVNPEWGAFGPTDNPALDRDDTDGAGPEVISLEHTEALTYRVGVHYWSDWSYGPANATVRIYLDGLLQDEWTVHVRSGDMWESHTIDAATGVVTRLLAGEGPVITPEYPVNTGLPF